MPVSAEIFAEYPNRFFVETGTYCGDGVVAALQAGFKDIRSVELSARLCELVRARFAAQPGVRIWCGESPLMLPDMLRDIDGPATFWLDAHYSSGITAHGPEVCPLLRELEAIAAHPVKTHTILIDDVRLLGNEFPMVTRARVDEALLRINPAYKIALIESGWRHLGLDILAACP